jgi:hypothetical protein
VPSPNALDVGQRFEQLRSKRSCPHGGLGFVEEGEERAAALAVERTDQLEVANRRIVQDEAVTCGVERGLVNLRMSLVRLGITEDQRCCAPRRVLARELRGLLAGERFIPTFGVFRELDGAQSCIGQALLAERFELRRARLDQHFGWIEPHELADPLWSELDHACAKCAGRELERSDAPIARSRD